MVKTVRRPLSIALGALATTMLGGCYYGDIYGPSYASSGYACESRYGASYYDEYDPYAYDDGYGYDCYDGSDYGSGFVQIGFGGGWYDNYYYPGHGLWMYDSYRHRYPLQGQYLNYWGGRRAWWKHHSDRPGNGQWNHSGRGDDGPRGTHPGGGRPPIATPPGSPVAGQPTRPPRGPQAVRPRPRPETVAGDPAPERPAMGRPRPTVERPAGAPRPPRGEWNGGNRPSASGRPARNPDSVRPAARPSTPQAGPPPASRPAATAPATRPAPPAARPAPRPRGGDRANHSREN